MPAPVPVLLMVRELSLGGSERQMAETAKALDRALFDPRVGCFRPAGIRGDELRASGVPIQQFQVDSLASFRGAIQIIRYIRREGIRVVHTFDTPANLYGVPASRMAGGAVVLSSQRVHRSLWPSGVRHALRVTDRMVDGIVVNCDYMRRHMRAEEHAPEDLLHLCYNGIDTSLFRAEPRTRPAPLQRASLVIGVVCGLRPEKGLHTLVEAFEAVRHVQPGLMLAMVGSGECLPALQDQARSLGVYEDCVFEPATARVPEWLHGIDIFVLPSLSEALSNSLMEAMACGCAVVATRVGGNPELVTHGRTGMLFEPRDTAGLAGILRFLIENPGLRGELACHAAALIHSRFSLAAAAARMGEIYLSLLGG